jgi:hypothetical protein
MIPVNMIRPKIFIQGILAVIFATANVTRAEALTWQLSATTQSGGTITGYFDYTDNLTTVSNNTEFSNINITVNSPKVGNFSIIDPSGYSGDVSSGFDQSGNVQVSFNVQNSTETGVYSLFLDFSNSIETQSSPISLNQCGMNCSVQFAGQMGTYDWIQSGTIVAQATSVPFEIPGGASIPVLGSAIGLGVLRKVRKFKTDNVTTKEISY